ncbi:MAG: polysaccharide pyruvyl transferase family protein, partial [Frankiaceae bacterium]
DPFWWHGIGVLSVLEMAQRQGKPTAMFGQGVGPLTHRGLVRMARRVVPDVDVVGLRERVRGPRLLEAIGVSADKLRVTGDEALELAVPAGPAPAGPAHEDATREAGNARGLGINVRVAAYAGVAADLLPVLAAAVQRAADAFGAPVVPLPVSLYPEDAEPDAIAEIIPAGRLVPEPALRMTLQTPADLVTAAGKCRAVLTGSYHAAVFALAQGVPAVCLVNSPYYAGKFDGLAGLFPTTCSIVNLQDATLPATLDQALAAAWRTSRRARELARRSARAQLQAGRDAYEYFATIAEKRVSRRWGDRAGAQAPGPG